MVRRGRRGYPFFNRQLLGSPGALFTLCRYANANRLPKLRYILWRRNGKPAAGQRLDPEASLPALPLGLASAALRYRQAFGRGRCCAADTTRDGGHCASCYRCGAIGAVGTAASAARDGGSGRGAGSRHEPRGPCAYPACERACRACRREAGRHAGDDPAARRHCSDRCPHRWRCQASTPSLAPILAAVAVALLVAIFASILAAVLVAVAPVTVTIATHCSRTCAH